MSVRETAEMETLRGTNSNHQGLPTHLGGGAGVCDRGGGKGWLCCCPTHGDVLPQSETERTTQSHHPNLHADEDVGAQRGKGTGQEHTLPVCSGIRTSTRAQRGFLDWWSAPGHSAETLPTSAIPSPKGFV